MKLLETNSEKLAFEIGQFKEDLDQIVPTMNNWEKSEQKEELAQTLAWVNKSKTGSKLKKGASPQ